MTEKCFYLEDGYCTLPSTVQMILKKRNSSHAPDYLKNLEEEKVQKLQSMAGSLPSEAGFDEAGHTICNVADDLISQPDCSGYVKDIITEKSFSLVSLLLIIN